MKRLLLIIAVALLAASCSNKKEHEALTFLNASMPLCDAVDYSQDYYLQNIKASFKARKELPWGKRVPEREFKHFVLPVRVNNENLDDFRMVYYEELRNRVKDLPMYDAVLEVNHWCHEKVNYKGSDSRTSAPMATIKTSWGRCGEESTLLVSALRAVCIPARQVYVPRWAHCDDNHAWVEAWVDGQWHFLGACEPEPVLDLGWFNAPASRALLVHTRVLGDYDGPEEVISKTPYYTEINVVDNYAETAQLNVKVIDNDGNAVSEARVDFKIYNYSEYNTVATKYTDNKGYTWLTAGLGTMMVYASKDGKFGWEVVTVGSADTITITICRDAIHRFSMENMEYDFDIIPPVENARIPDVSAEMRAANNSRLAVEDSIRNAYIAKCVAAQNEGDYDREIMAKTWGNYQIIKEFIDYARAQDREEDACILLHNLTDKDLRDVSMDILKDCLDNDMLNPRVSNEMLRPFVTMCTSSLPDSITDLIKWVNDSITVDDVFAESRTPISPAGVLRSRVADSHSRDIFFVALARSKGITSRIDAVTGKVQYFDNQWIDVELAAVDADDNPSQKPGTLVIEYQDDDDPRYYTHFSIKKFNGNTFDLLAYDAMDPGMDVGMTLSQMMANGGITLDPAYYVLSFGPRLTDGSVLNRLIFFYIESGKTTNVKMTMRQTSVEKGRTTSAIKPSSEGLRIVAYLDGGSEPTTHAMQEISILKEKFEKLKGEITFYFKDEEDYSNFKLKKFNELPDNINYEIKSDMPADNLPVFRVTDDNNEVVFESKGYQIGLAEQILRCFPT